MSFSSSLSLSTLPPLALYVHIPWCVRKCPYCDFNSHTVSDSNSANENSAPVLPERDYLQQLFADLDADAHMAQGRKLTSIFFGGGTPSLFSGAAIGSIIEAAQARIGLDPLCEITLEANPGTVDRQRFREYRAAGVNRLSIGIQSLDTEQLRRLGRIHNPDDALAAYKLARDVGFDNINLDLMHGLPEQTLTAALADLDGVIGLEPEHISWYQLTIEPNTVFYNSPPKLPDDDKLADIEAEGFERLAAAGFDRYEISAFCRDGKRARHNLNYWAFGDYLGIGAGAHGKITGLSEGQIVRQQKTRLPSHYLARDQSYSTWSAVAPDQLPLEFMLNALRLIDGVPSDYFRERTGLPLDTIASEIDLLRQKQLLELDQDRIQTSALGRRFLNDALAQFMV